MGNFLENLVESSPEIISGIDTSIKKYQNKEAALEAERIKRVMNLEEYKDKMIIKHEYNTSPEVIKNQGIANFKTEDITRKLNILNQTSTILGKEEGKRKAAEERELLNQQNKIVANINGENVTLGEYKNMMEVQNAINILDLENRLKKPKYEQERDMLKTATLLGIRRDLWGNDYEKLAGLILDENLRITELTKRVELNVVTDLALEHRYTEKDKYWDTEKGREYLQTYGKGHEVLQPVLEEMDRYGIVSLGTNITNQEKKEIIDDFISVSQGYNNKVSLDENTLELYNDWAVKNRRVKINEDKPWLLFKTENHIAFSNMRKNPGARISMYTQLINQFTNLPDEVFQGLPKTKQKEIIPKVKNYMMQIQNLLKKTKIDKHGNTVMDTSTQISLGDLGITYDNSPEWLLTAIRDHTKQHVPGNNIPVINKNTDAIEISSTDLSVQNKDRVLLPVLFNGQSAPDKEYIEAATFAHAIRTGSNISVDYETTDEVQIAIGEAQTYPIPVVGAYIWKDVLFSDGTMQLRPQAPHPDIIYQAVVKADRYAKKRAESGPAAIYGGMDFDPHTYYSMSAESIYVNINDKIIQSAPNFVAWKKEKDKTFVGTGSKGVYTFLDVEWLGHNGVDQANSRDAALQSRNAYQAAILLMDNIKRTGVSSALVINIAQLLDGFKEFPKQFKGALSEYFSSDGSRVMTLSDLGGDTVDYVQGLINNGELEQNMGASLLAAAETVGEVGDISEEDFAKGLADIANGDSTTEASKSALLAQQKMYHSALVFYAAAAFQGEGGKAISDGDRKFVEWALNYGSFTTVVQRLYAIQGMVKIISKSMMINELLSSTDANKVYVGLHYNEYFGANVITLEEMPAQVLAKDPFILEELKITQATGGTLLNMSLKNKVDLKYYESIYDEGAEKIDIGRLDEKVLPTSNTAIGLASQGVEQGVMQEKKIEDQFVLTVGNTSISVSNKSESGELTETQVGEYLNWIKNNGGNISDYTTFKDNISVKFHKLIENFTRQYVRTN